MKTALLVCDHVLAELVPEHGDYPAMFSKMLPELKLDPWYVCDENFPPINDYEAFVITGSKYSVYDDLPWIHQLKDFVTAIRDSGKKCIGVCFGHQVIAEALGGKVAKAKTGYLIGVHTFYMLQHMPWIPHKKASFNMLMLCQDQVETLPPGADILAGNDRCPVGMYQIGYQFLTVQGHPEFTKAYDQAVFTHRSERIGQDRIQRALESFSLEPDRTWMVEMMMAFLHHQSDD